MICQEQKLNVGDLNVDSTNARGSKRTNKYYHEIFIAVLTVVLAIVANCFSSDQYVGPNTVYVPGAGFSGFWFLLGQLHSKPNPLSKTYYCFSAGCLGVVATMNNFTVDQVSCAAVTIQNQWKSGEISRFDVLASFVDSLIYQKEPSLNHTTGYGSCFSNRGTYMPLHDDPKAILSQLRIMTSMKSNMGIESVIRTPQSLVDLREMLIQSAWIPFATGNGLWRNGHNDGAFTVLSHPKCEETATLPWSLDIYLNAVNVNLGLDKAKAFWDAGFAHGL